MARTTWKQIVHPYYKPPYPPPSHPRPTPLIQASGRPECFASPNDEVTATPLDEDSLILPPREYSSDDGDEWWREQVSANSLFKTCIAYEQIGEDSPRIARYIARDEWTGLPILAKPTGLTLVGFLPRHEQNMYQSETVDSIYLPLIFNWAFQALSGLSFFHSHNIIFNDLHLRTCWLSSDLSLSLVGFMGAEFRDEFGELNIGNHISPVFRLTLIQKPNIQSDLFDWGTFIYVLMTYGLPEGNANYDETKALVHQQNFPALASDLMGDMVKKCWMKEYGSAAELRKDIEAFLTLHGYEVEGDNIKNFDPTNIPQFAMLKDTFITIIH
ncbi:hypothetical protein B7463_g12422, partial [Scytalidium lignicola]